MKTIKILLSVFPLLILSAQLFSQPSYQWMRRYNSPADHHDYGGECAYDNAGNYYICGTTLIGGVTSDITLLKYSSAGVLIWSRQYNGPSNSNDEPQGGISVDNSGNIYLAGFSYSSSSNYDYLLLKYNSSGTLWVNRDDGP